AAAAAGKHVFLDKPIANTIADARAITAACRKTGVVLALGYQRRRESPFRWIRRQIDDGVFGKLVNAEANISRDRLGKFDLTSWRYTAKGMPGGVMLQIGIHYTDVLEYLLGPVKAVNARLAQLVLPGDNPDVASLVLEHESGALATLNASYASASEYYLMNVYGKEASAYYDLHQGLRFLKRGGDRSSPVALEKNDAIRDELEEFAAAVRGEGQPEMDGERGTASLAVIRAGIESARTGRRVEVAEILSRG
ncbi:MAG TPA: Gfo/Idh/MocA family oxidoreductase, partial [Burkholderiales bacterium]|nr:Gfo/Idh/MocA family oxidoreductase [Burkholderiales bacterium]